MNAVVRKHFTVAMDWKEKTLEQWLEQYGSWLLLDCHYERLGYSSQMGRLVDIANGVMRDRSRRALPRCNITDDQAQAIEDMVNHLMETENEKVKKWLTIMIDYHVNAYSEEQIAGFYDLSRFAVTRDKMLGLVRVATRFKLNSHITG